MSTQSAKDVSNPSQLLLSLPVHPVEVSRVFKLDLSAMKFLLDVMCVLGMTQV